MNNLKTFYKLDQVAKELGANTTEDILRLALDGHLTLSVNLTAGLLYEPCKPYKELDPLYRPPLLQPDELVTAGKDLLRSDTRIAKTISPADSKPLDIVIDSGNVRSVLESLFVLLPDNQLSKAEFGFKEAVFKNGEEFIRPIGSEDYIFRIPEDGYLVITKANLDAFKAKLGATIAKPNKDKKDLSLRNEAIRQDAKDGLTNALLQKKYGLGKSTISEICNEEKRAGNGSQSALAQMTRTVHKMK